MSVLSKILEDGLLKNLNKEQVDAVLAPNGPVLIYAGPGTGKTRVLVSRYIYLILLYAQDKIHDFADHILAVTFTNKAASEIGERVNESLKNISISGLSITYNPYKAWIGTFHGICLRILREKLPFEVNIAQNFNNFSIIDARDQLKIIKKIVEDNRLSGDLIKVSYTFIGKIKEIPESISNHAFDLENCVLKNEYEAVLYKDLCLIFSCYTKYLIENNLIDFNDIIIKAMQLLQNSNEILDYYQSKFQHILVDEYQDTNSIQREFLYLLLSKRATKSGSDHSKKNIFCVGDENQSIYGWRGANGSMTEFAKSFPGVKVINLVQNYRSTVQILKAAEKLINVVYHAEKKTVLISASDLHGENVKVFGYRDGIEEAAKIAAQILFYVASGMDYSSFAILVRNNSQIKLIEEQMIASKIPYKLVGDTKFYDYIEIKDILAYLKCIANVNDNLAFSRIINTPKRGLGSVFFDRLDRFAKFSLNNSSLQLSSYLFLQNNEHAKSLSSAQHQNLSKFLKILTDYRAKFYTDITSHGSIIDSSHVLTFSNQSLFQGSLDEFFVESTTLDEDIRFKKYSDLYSIVNDNCTFARNIADLIIDSGYYDSCIENHDKNIDKIKDFINICNNFSSITELLDYVSLNAGVSLNTHQNVVSLMTIHASKGLEFDFVFLPGWENGILPSIKSIESGVYEERRLAYVAITRAKKYVYISYAHNRQIDGVWRNATMSNFIDDLRNKYVEFQDLYLKYKNKYNNLRRDEGMVYEHDGRTTINDLVDCSEYDSAIKTGDIVTHVKFGKGIVTAVDGDIMNVRFSDAIRKIFVEFLTKN